MESKPLRIPNTFVLICGIIGLAAVLTWVVPGGSYDLVERGGRMVADPNSFHYVDSNPQGFWDVLKAPVRGFEAAADIIAFVLLIGGAFSVLARTDAIHEGIQAVVARHEESERVRRALIPLFMTLFSFGGAVFGMSEETIPFILVFVPLAIAIGYDSIVGVAIPFVGAGAGFAGAFLNPFTVGVAQGIAEVPPFSGMGYRLAIWACTTAITIYFVMRYARRIAERPERSPVYDLDAPRRAELAEDGELETPELGVGVAEGVARRKQAVTRLFLGFAAAYLVFMAVLFATGRTEAPVRWLLELNAFEFFALVGFVLFALLAARMTRGETPDTGMTSRHLAVLLTFTLSLLVLVLGVTRFGWYIVEIAALFFLAAILMGVVGRLSADAFTEAFMDGAKDLVATALIIGFARAIVVVAEDGQIIHTILHALAGTVEGVHPIVSSQAMFAVQTCINFLVPSGSGQAALTMPIMAPLADLVGVSRQTAVLAFQLGDGFTNLIIPTSPVLMGGLTLAGIPWIRWAKWMLPLQVILFLFALVALVPAYFLTW